MENREFGTRLRELRKQAGLSQRGLADKIGVNFTYLSKIESGAMPPPSEKVILRLARVLNADTDELMTLAGRIPADIAQILRSRQALELLRSQRTQKKVKASSNRRVAMPKFDIGALARAEGSRLSAAVHRAYAVRRIGVFEGRWKGYKNLSKAAIAVALAVAVGLSLWFAVPTKALEISFPSPPASGTIGSTTSFTVKIDIANLELLPIESVTLYIYKSDARGTYEATFANLPLDTTVTPYTTIAATGTSGTAGTVSITATVSNWGWSYGYGYALWEGTPQFFDYGYGYGYGGGAASMTYAVTWTSPSSWPVGEYKVDAKITADSTTFSQSSGTFALSTPAVGIMPSGPPSAPAAPAPEPGVTDVSDVITDEGVFTEEVTAESDDSKVTLTIDEDTIGTTAEGEPISEISIADIEEPPAPPADSSIVGLTYDLGPDGATFEPAITITFTYDPAEIPEGVNEEDLVLAMWDEDAGDAGEWVVLEGATVDPVTHTITAPVSHFTAFTILGAVPPEVEVEEIAALEESISELEAQVASLQGDVTAAQAQAASAQADYDAVQSDVTATQADYDTAQSEVTATQAQVASLQTDLAEAQERLAETQERVDELEAEAGIAWWVWLIVGLVGAAVIGVIVWLVLRRRQA